jgi:hypothetical protein
MTPFLALVFSTIQDFVANSTALVLLASAGNGVFFESAVAALGDHDFAGLARAFMTDLVAGVGQAVQEFSTFVLAGKLCATGDVAGNALLFFAAVAGD